MHYTIQNATPRQFLRLYLGLEPGAIPNVRPAEVHFTEPVFIELIGETPDVQAFVIEPRGQTFARHWIGPADNDLITRGAYSWLAVRFPGITFYGPSDIYEYQRKRTRCLVDASGVHVAAAHEPEVKAPTPPPAEDPFGAMPAPTEPFTMEVDGETVEVMIDPNAAMKFDSDSDGGK